MGQRGLVVTEERPWVGHAAGTPGQAARRKAEGRTQHPGLGFGALGSSCCVTLGKSHDFSGPYLPPLQTEMMLGGLKQVKVEKWAEKGHWRGGGA